MGLIVCNVGYMRYYDNDNFEGDGGGAYIRENRDGGEKYNFHVREDGTVHGFVETGHIERMEMFIPDNQKNINIENIEPGFENEEVCENVRVIFISKSPTLNQRVVVGWYDHATVYRRRQVDDIMLYGYNFVCNANDAHLINYEDRNFIYPRRNPDGTCNYGQGQFFYPYNSEHRSVREFAKRVEDYIDNLPANCHN